MRATTVTAGRPGSKMTPALGEEVQGFRTTRAVDDPAQGTLTRYVLAHLAIDRWLAVFVVLYVAVMAPLIPRWTDNAAFLAAFTNDEPFITQQLDGMTVRPYGNPSNFLEPANASEIPAYWLKYRYFNLIYYGGTYLDPGFAAFMPLKTLGVPAFPSAPIILRAITFLAGLLSLMLMYSFARRHIGTAAAVVATATVATDVQFIYLAKFIHPDMLQFLLLLLALIVATHLAKEARIKDVVVLGVLLGLIQGTKSGAPFALPMALLALAWGELGRHRRLGARPIAAIAWKGVAMGVAAFVAFVASTPYLLFDPYYLNTTKAAFAILSGTSPLIPITFASWYEGIATYLSWPLIVLIAAGLGLFLLRLTTRRADAGVVLGLVLGVSNLLWFTSVGRFWVILYYLVPALYAAGLCLGLVAQEIYERPRGANWNSLGPVPRYAAVLLVACMAIGVGGSGLRIPNLAESLAMGVNVDRTPQVRLNAWAVDNMPRGSKILFDDEAYFDPRLFPNQATNANVIRYMDLYRQEPDYFVLTEYPDGVTWINIKRKTQHFDVLNDDPYSVRLYQDLIDQNSTPYQPGPTPIRGVSLVAVYGLPFIDKQDQPAWFSAFDSGYRVINPGYQGVQSALSKGHRLLLYHAGADFYATDISGLNTGHYQPISSPSAPGNPVQNAFDGSSPVWRAAGEGKDANGAYVGVDFGASEQIDVRELQIKWVAASWLPGHLLVQYSDDGVTWRTAESLTPVVPPDVGNAPGTKRWWVAYEVPSAGAHRMWRVAAADMAADHFFGLDELVFHRTQTNVVPAS